MSAPAHREFLGLEHGGEQHGCEHHGCDQHGRVEFTGAEFDPEPNFVDVHDGTVLRPR